MAKRYSLYKRYSLTRRSNNGEELIFRDIFCVGFIENKKIRIQISWLLADNYWSSNYWEYQFEELLGMLGLPIEMEITQMKLYPLLEGIVNYDNKNQQLIVNMKKLNELFKHLDFIHNLDKILVKKED
jgi:hypothetical protein